MTAAHKTLPFGTRIRVTRAERSVGRRAGQRSLRLHRTAGSSTVAEGAARKLDMMRAGVVQVRLEVLQLRPTRATTGACRP